MTAKGHMTLASASTIALMDTALYFHGGEIFQMIDKRYFIEYVSIFYFFVIFGSLLPDIDESKSYIGRRLSGIAIIMSSIFKHRTFTHYLILPVSIFISSFFVESIEAKIAIYGLAFGVLMHDAGDMLTKGGINGFFFPFFPTTKIALLPRIFRFYTNSVTEYLVILVLIIANIVFVYVGIKEIADLGM